MSENKTESENKILKDAIEKIANYDKYLIRPISNKAFKDYVLTITKDALSKIT